MVTTAFVGAGVVAIGAGAAMPNAKAISPSALTDIDGTLNPDQLAARAEAAERASRDEARGLATSMNQAKPDVWELPLHDYKFTSPYGIRWGKLHAGVDLAAPEGTPYHAVHGGTVTMAGWYGGYGYCVIIDHGNGLETVYGHSSKLLVREGQHVEAGDTLGLVGNTGHSFGAHLHLEIHVNGVPKDPIPWFRGVGVDIKLETESIYGGVVGQ